MCPSKPENAIERRNYINKTLTTEITEITEN